MNTSQSNARSAIRRIAEKYDLGPSDLKGLKAYTQPDRIQSPEDGFAILAPKMGTFDQEHLVVMVLNTRNEVLDIVDVYKGSVNASMIRISEVFRTAIVKNAPAILVAHNHPSGDPTPSPEDLAVTRAMVDAGKLLDIEVLDHLIIGASGFVSLKSKGLMSPTVKLSELEQAA